LRLDPDPHKSRNSKASEAQNRAVDAQNGGLEAQNGALEGLWTCGRRIRICIKVESWIRIRIKVEIQKFQRLKIEPWTLTMEAWRFKMEPWRVYRPVVADSYHYEEELDPDSDPHLSEKLDLDPH
jgi:hypothetical protein